MTLEPGGPRDGHRFRRCRGPRNRTGSAVSRCRGRGPAPAVGAPKPRCPVASPPPKINDRLPGAARPSLLSPDCPGNPGVSMIAKRRERCGPADEAERRHVGFPVQPGEVLDRENSFLKTACSVHSATNFADVLGRLGRRPPSPLSWPRIMNAEAVVLGMHDTHYADAKWASSFPVDEPRPVTKLRVSHGAGHGPYPTFAVHGVPRTSVTLAPSGRSESRTNVSSSARTGSWE